MGRGLRRLLRGTALAAVLAAAGWAALDRWIATAPVPALVPEVSATVLDRDGRLLRAYTVADGRWRLPVAPEDVDPAYLAQLLAYEDARFYDHPGVDPLALMRAAWQFVSSGRIVSGGSTLTMQVARLLTEAPSGQVGAKLAQIRLALALERRLSKREILKLYLTLAPFGGNIEGVRAASLSYLGKEPRHLGPAEAALLVALPQSPEARRPDRAPDTARAARDRVLARAVGRGVLDAGEAARARAEAVPASRRPFPMLAPHLADRMRAEEPGAEAIRLTLDATLQAGAEALARAHAARLGPGVSAAILVADHQTGEVLASVGSADFLDGRAQGFVDMTRALRSPGSTLKPLIYGLAFEAGLAHPESMVEDRPTAFGAYVPENFDRAYQGTVTVRRALQMSLNVPAIAALDAVGPARLLARMRRAGVEAALPPGGAPGLAIGLGGLGLTLADLATLYAGIAHGGETVALAARPGGPGAAPRTLLTPEAAWQVVDILAGVPAPVGAATGTLAYKTGTSYGYRDAWAVGFDGRHVAAVWLGRPDATPVPGLSGIEAAAPLLFELFGRIGPVRAPLAPPPPGVLTVSNAGLPLPLRHLRGPVPAPMASAGPEIAFPPDGARIDLGLRAASPEIGLALKVRGGRPPFTWLLGGRPLDGGHERAAFWHPDGPGFVAISVIDATGRADRVRVFLQ